MTASRIGVVFVVSSLCFGGAEKHTLQLFNSLDPVLFRLGLVYLKRQEHLSAQIRPERLPQVWCADFGRGLDTAGMLRLRKWLGFFSPDAVVCVNTYPLFYGHIASWLNGGRSKIVEIFHSTELPPSDDRSMRWVYRHLFNRSDKIVYVSETQRRYWEHRGIRRDLGICLHNGIDTDYFCDRYTSEQKNMVRSRHGFSTHDFVVGICAALRPEKRHVDLLRAIARLKADGLPAKCLVIGDGPCRSEIESGITALGLASSAAITGFQEDVRPFIAACDCMALVSQIEAFSLSALEAMAMGKPMVMSDVGGAAEQIVNGEHGYIYPRGDIDRLTEALQAFYDPGNRLKFGEAARRRVDGRFRYDQMVERYSALLASMHEVT